MSECDSACRMKLDWYDDVVVLCLDVGEFLSGASATMARLHGADMTGVLLDGNTRGRVGLLERQGSVGESLVARVDKLRGTCDVGPEPSRQSCVVSSLDRVALSLGRALDGMEVVLRQLRERPADVVLPAERYRSSLPIC